MDLLDRYLNAVRWALIGRSRRDDIIAELRDDLLTRMEAKEAEFGRPLTESEVAAVLKADGHPLVAAARYRERQFLIGPTILPFYEAALKVMLALLLLLSLVQVLASGRPVHALRHVIGDDFSAALSLIGAATLIAVLLERFEVKLRFIEDWRPSDLPRVRQGASWTGDNMSQTAGGSYARPRSPFALGPANRWESLFELAIVLIFTAWWTGLTRWSAQGVWVTPDVRLGPGPVWGALYWPVLGVAGVQALAAAIRFVQTRRTLLSTAADLVATVAGVALAAVLLASGGHWVEIEIPAASALEMQNLNATLDATTRICLVVGIAIAAVQAVRALWMLVGRQRVQSSPA